MADFRNFNINGVDASIALADTTVNGLMSSTSFSSLSDISTKVSNISKEFIIDESEEITIQLNVDSSILLSITESGVDATNLKCNGVDVLTTDNILIQNTSIIDSYDDTEEIVYSDDNDTEEYAKIGSYGIKTKNILNLNGDSLVPKQRIIVVDQNGNGDYTTIEDALNNANDSSVNHVVIQLNVGTYYPEPKISNNCPYVEHSRNLTIRGVNRNKCIIQGDIGFYDYTIGTDCSPLRLNGNVTIENLTILSYSSKYRDYYGTDGFVTTRTGRNAAYCIHRDGYSMEGDEFVVKNCILINDHMTTIGFGTKTNVVLRIEDCYLQSEQNDDDSIGNNYGTLYGHFNNATTGLGQDLEIIRCQIVNKTSYQAIHIMDAKSSSATPEDTFGNYKFIGNSVYTTNNSSALVISSTLEGFYEISPLSFGNNCDLMNK